MVDSATFPSNSATADCGRGATTDGSPAFSEAGRYYHHGWTAEEQLRQHPGLKPEQVYSALAYFYDQHADLLAQLKASLQDAERVRPGYVFSSGDWIC